MEKKEKETKFREEKSELEENAKVKRKKKIQALQFIICMTVDKLLISFEDSVSSSANTSHGHIEGEN